MKKKTFTGSKRSLDKVEEYRKHFGWVTETRHDEVLVMTYDSKQKNVKTLRKLEVQADIINSKFPWKMIPWLILAIAFFVCYFVYDNGNFFGMDLNTIFLDLFKNDIVAALFVGLIPVVFLIVAGINTFFTLYAVIVFFILKFTKFKTLAEIFRMADALSGNIIDAPLKRNIEPPSEHTGVLASLTIGSNNRKSV